MMAGAGAARGAGQVRPRQLAGGAEGQLGTGALHLAATRLSAPSGVVSLAKRRKGGQIVQPTDEVPYTNGNVKNRVARNCKPEQVQHWLDTPCIAPSSVPGANPVPFGALEHWGKDEGCTRAQWLRIEEVEVNSPEWQQAVDGKWIQPAEVQAPFPRKQLRVRPQPLPTPHLAFSSLCHPRCLAASLGAAAHRTALAPGCADHTRRVHRRRVSPAPRRGTGA